jgi:hypothetical protein
LLYGNRLVGALVVTGRSSRITIAKEVEIGLGLKSSGALLSHSAPSLRAAYYLFNPPIVPAQIRGQL